MLKKILVGSVAALIGAFLGAMANKKGRELGEANLETDGSKEDLC